MTIRDSEEIRLNYCKKCGFDLDDHDDEFCSMNKYPAIYNDSYEVIIKTAEFFKIDLTEANMKCADGGRHGSMEGDIYLDIISILSEILPDLVELRTNIIAKLDNFGYEPKEITNALNKISLK